MYFVKDYALYVKIHVFVNNSRNFDGEYKRKLKCIIPETIDEELFRNIILAVGILEG